MDFAPVKELPGRVRVKLRGPVPEGDVCALEQAVRACPDVERVTVYPRIGEMAVCYTRAEGAKGRLFAHLATLKAADIQAAQQASAYDPSAQTRALVRDILCLVGAHYARRWFLPAPLRTAWTVWSYRTFLAAGLNSLMHGRLDVPVLDAAAIGMAFLCKDPKTASSTMFLLNLGETLEDYTRARSQGQLIRSLLDAPETAQLIEGDRETSVPMSSLREGDLIAVRTGMPISVDGTVESGCAMVNQAALTGEPLAVERSAGDDVFAGTAVESGEILVRVHAGTGDTRLRSIVALVEQSEGLKAGVQTRREALANKIVPWNFLLAGIVALTTKSLVKTAASLMVDYSCALKLTGSIAVLSAMNQSVREGFLVKGSKHFEAMAKADTIVFDKTGTLTNAEPQVAGVLAFDGWDEEEVLRFSACLEEHFPHPVARAVVRAAAQQGLKHRERHAEVEYIVAHGIASSLDGKRCVIGSEHFIVEDEGVQVDEAAHARIDEAFGAISSLYLAVDGQLVGVIGIHDPIKPGVPEAVARLRALGFEHIVMLTGDNERAAAPVAAQAGITEYCANMLPEGKHAYIEQLKAQGRRVVMVGDGVNDSPALSLADVGVAMGNGTAIAKEVADITLSEGDLSSVVALRQLSCELLERMDLQFREVMAFNTALLALGIAGVIAPATSGLLHNGSTVAFAAQSTRAYRLDAREAVPAQDVVVEP